MLKLTGNAVKQVGGVAAAFGRLCVETLLLLALAVYPLAAAFGRLCVETVVYRSCPLLSCAAAFGRLCVETVALIIIICCHRGSRLRAAVC